MAIIPFKTSSPVGSVIDGAENISTIDPDYLPINSITTEDLQPTLFPILIGEPSMWSGSFANIPVEDVPAAFGVSTSQDFNQAVHQSANGLLTLMVWRQGYSLPAVGTVVLSVSNDLGATWNHSQAFDYDGGTDTSKMVGVNVFTNIPAQTKQLFTIPATCVDNASIQTGDTLLSFDNALAGVSPQAVKMDLLTGVISRQSFSGVVGVGSLTCNLLTKIGDRFFSGFFDAGNSNFILFSTLDIDGAWLQTFSTTDSDNNVPDISGISDPFLIFLNGIYYLTQRTATSKFTQIYFSSDLVTWQQIPGFTVNGVSSGEYNRLFQNVAGENFVVFSNANNDISGTTFTVAGFTDTISPVVVIGFFDGLSISYQPPNSEAFVFDSFRLTLGSMFALVGVPATLAERTAINAPDFPDSEAQTGWRDKIGLELTLYIESFTDNTGASNLVLRLYTPQREEVRSVENYGNTHSLASTFLRGE